MVMWILVEDEARKEEESFSRRVWLLTIVEETGAEKLVKN